MCKEFQEVDKFGAKLLIEMIKEPSKAPIPRLNPFSPVILGEGIYQAVQLIHQTIQYLKNPQPQNISQQSVSERYDDRNSIDRTRKIQKRDERGGGGGRDGRYEGRYGDDRDRYEGRHDGSGYRRRRRSNSSSD